MHVEQLQEESREYQSCVQHIAKLQAEVNALSAFGHEMRAQFVAQAEKENS